MNELKVIDVDKMADVRSLSGRFYRKSEADKVIAELKADYKEACDRLQTANLIKDEQIAATRYQKYKRCLDKAGRCGICAQFEHYKVIRFDNPFYLKRAKWLEKWRDRWIKIATQFKEEK